MYINGSTCQSLFISRVNLLKMCSPKVSFLFQTLPTKFPASLFTTDALMLKCICSFKRVGTKLLKLKAALEKGGINLTDLTETEQTFIIM